MSFRALHKLLALVACVLAFGLAPEDARASTTLTVCSAPGATRTEAVPAADWRCGSGAVDLDAERNVVRLDVAPGETPRYVISRAARFSTISVGVVSGDHIVWTKQDFEDVEATFFDRQFAVPLPDSTGRADAVLVAVERATQDATFDYLRLEQQLPGNSRFDLALLLIVALFTGMMLMPILFDVVFFRILRERFILWHAGLVASLAVQLVCSFGLYTAFTTVHLPVVRLVTIGSFNIMIIAGVMFSLRFIEPSKLPRRLARVLVALAAFFTAISCVHMAGIEALGTWPSKIYYISGGPLGIVFLALLLTALRRGSRAVHFLIVGLSPLLLLALIRVFSFILPEVPTIDANALLLVATIIEVVATALGVANRFLSLKHDRDRVQAKMGQLEGAIEKDALTGLLNRRVIDNRYEDLRAQGFDTFALIDLDHFKDINDRYGHQTGDAVLVACAAAIRVDDDRDTIALRLGGEEFVLLLRGKNVTGRAEALRQAIPRRIAADVPELDRLVTASMGVLELPRGALDLMEFDEIYARADKLLYEAKAAGRNRMLYERLRLFDPGLPRKNPQQIARIAASGS